MSEPNITLGYWGIRGLAAPLRMMLMYKNVPFKCECYDIKEKPEGGTDASSWFTTKAGLKVRA